MMLVLEGGRKISRRSWSAWIGLLEFVLAFSLYYYPDWSKIFLFILPLVICGVGAIEFGYKYFRKKDSVLNLVSGIVFAAVGIYLCFLGRKTFMVGVAIMLLVDAVRFFACSRSENIRIFEKLIFIAAALLAASWMLLVLFKGLHLYWSVRECLALYFTGAAVLSFFRKR